MSTTNGSVFIVDDDASVRAGLGRFMRCAGYSVATFSSAQKFLADHYDTFEKKEGPNERSLCGHIAVSPRGAPEWEDPPFNPGGAVTAQAADLSLIHI